MVQLLQVLIQFKIINLLILMFQIHSLNGIKLLKLMVLHIFKLILCLLIMVKRNYNILFKIVSILISVLPIKVILILLNLLLILLKIFLFKLFRINSCNFIQINTNLILRILLLFIHLILVESSMNLLPLLNFKKVFKVISILLIRTNSMLFQFLFISLILIIQHIL